MHLPGYLPEELSYASGAESDHELLMKLLMTSLSDLVLFFEYASEDETWSLAHQTFMAEAIEQFTRRFVKDSLPSEYIPRIISKIREHPKVLVPLLKNNIWIALNEQDQGIAANSLLWAGASPYFRDAIRIQCGKGEGGKVVLEEIPPRLFLLIEEFVQTGTVRELWRREYEEILEGLKQASKWNLPHLMELCQDVLKRYITQTNAVAILIQAHEEQWTLLKNSCIDYINSLEAGVRFKKGPSDQLQLEFLDYGTRAMAIFEAVRFHVTHLFCSYSLTDVPGFSDVVTQTPQLISVDVDGSNAFSERLLDIPHTIKELDLSRCEWLNSKNLKRLIEHFPHLSSLHLAKNVQLPYSAWSHLKDLKRLESLDLNQCEQIQNEDFKIIVQACNGVTRFSLSGCTGLSDLAFFEIGKSLPRLLQLDASKTHITDAGLIDLMVRCKNLTRLNVAQCPHLSDKGILESVQQGPALKQLILGKFAGYDVLAEEIAKLRPSVKLSNSSF